MDLISSSIHALMHANTGGQKYAHILVSPAPKNVNVFPLPPTYDTLLTQCDNSTVFPSLVPTHMAFIYKIVQATDTR